MGQHCCSLCVVHTAFRSCKRITWHCWCWCCRVSSHGIIAAKGLCCTRHPPAEQKPFHFAHTPGRRPRTYDTYHRQ